MDMSPQLEQALALLQQDPLPDDAEQQLEALEKDAPESEGEMFGDLWSALQLQMPPR
jgi:hypothetical protein